MVLSPPTHTPLAVDRDWLQKLLQRYNSDLPARVLAPMVDQSDLPFRLLCRRYNTNLCFTPMIHAGMYCKSKAYRSKFKIMAACQEDRPLIAQICGGSCENVLQTALDLQTHCDGIDLNCGCPQSIAKRGNYGAFLLEQEDLLLELVQTLSQRLSVPLSVKVRLLPTQNCLADSLALYTKLVDAGAHLLTIHARTRLQKGHDTGAADWNAIRQVVNALGHRVPILANGSIGSYEEYVACLEATGADGVMSSEAILEYPPLFMSPSHGPRISRVALAREYLALAKDYPPHIQGQGSGHKCVRMHIHRFLHADLQQFTDLRDLVVQAQTHDDLVQAVNAVEARQMECHHVVEEEVLSWYVRHRKDENCDPACDSDEEDEMKETSTLTKTATTMEDGNYGCALFGGDGDDEEDESVSE